MYTLGEIHPYPFTFSLGIPDAVERYRPSLGGCGSFATQVPNWESLKVIALDKFHVNPNISSGNLASQNTLHQPLTRRILLHKVKLLPYLRLAE